MIKGRGHHLDARDLGGFMKKVLRLSAFVLAWLPAVCVAAPETHVITPHYPDAFKIETVQTSDAVTTTNGQRSTLHTRMIYRQEVHKTANGYQATFTGVSADVDGRGPDDKPTPEAQQQQQILSLMATVGHAQVTLNDEMVPQSVDNIDDIKPRIKQGLTDTGDATKDAMGMKIYDAFISNATPQSAAKFLAQAYAGKDILRRPLVLHQPSPIDGDTVHLMGGAFKLTGTITLDDWQEGHSASLTTVFAPSDADMNVFLSGVMKTMLDRLATSNDDKGRDVVEAMIKQMHISMSQTCHTTIDLSNFVVSHSECDNVMSINMDIAKALPADLVKAMPKLAQISAMQTERDTHTVVDTHLLP